MGLGCQQPGDALTLTFRERQPNGRFQSVAFVKASARRIERACTDLRRSRVGQEQRALTTHEDPDIREQAAAKTLTDAVKGAKVKFKRRASDGELVWTFGAVRQSDIPALIAGLQAALVKTGE